MKSAAICRASAGRSRVGFTLLELLIVMSIMFLIMGMAMAAWFGIVQSSAIRGGISNLHRIISLARQHAMTHGTATYVFFRQDAGGKNARYWVCAAAGRHYGTNGVSELNAGYPRWVVGSLVDGLVYNLTDGSWGQIQDNGQQTITVKGGVLKNGQRNNWYSGDRFGWLTHETQYLPSTLMFNNTENPSAHNAPAPIVFLPDGTTERAGSGDYSVKIREKNGTAESELTVLGMTGLAE